MAGRAGEWLSELQARGMELHDTFEDSKWGGWWRKATATNIVLSFIAVCIENQVLPQRPETVDVWDVVDACFVVTFAIDLLGKWILNFFDAWWYASLSTLHLVAMLVIGIAYWAESDRPFNERSQGIVISYAVLRALRITRLVYIFRESEDLLIIGLTLRRALSKTCIALMLMVTVQAIYAVAGVSMFREARGFAFGSTDTEFFGDTAHTVVTARGFEYGAEYWGTFGRAMWTLFQTFTFESWSEVIARPLVFDELWWRCVAASIFFPSYIFLNSILLLNVLTSITVEAITSASELERSRQEADEAERREVVWKEAHLGSARVQAMIVKRVEALQKDDAARRAATELQRRWRGRKGRHRAKLEARRYYSEAMPKMWAETARKVSGIEENLETLLRLLLPPEPRLERVSMTPRAAAGAPSDVTTTSSTRVSSTSSSGQARPRVSGSELYSDV